MEMHSLDNNYNSTRRSTYQNALTPRRLLQLNSVYARIRVHKTALLAAAAQCVTVTFARPSAAPRNCKQCRHHPRRHRWLHRLAQLSASYSTLLRSLQVDLKGSAGTSAAFGYSYNHEHLHAGGAGCDAGGQRSSRRNGSSEEKSGMRKRGGKKAAITVSRDAKSFQFRPSASS